MKKKHNNNLQEKQRRTYFSLDMSYCSGVGCPKAWHCKRWIPSESSLINVYFSDRMPPVDKSQFEEGSPNVSRVFVWWVEPAYDKNKKCCPNFISDLPF